MTDLKKQIDELAGIKADMSKLKARKDKLEAEIIMQCSEDLENTKYKSVHYAGTYKDAVTEKTEYSLSAPAKRMLIGLWKGNFVRCTIKEVIEQMNGVSEDERKQLIKKCKGINYDKDVNNILKFTNISEDDAREYAYLISEAAVWQDFKNLLTVNGMDESHIDDILMKIQSSFVVEDSTKISLS